MINQRNNPKSYRVKKGSNSTLKYISDTFFGITQPGRRPSKVSGIFVRHLSHENTELQKNIIRISLFSSLLRRISMKWVLPSHLRQLTLLGPEHLAHLLSFAFQAGTAINRVAQGCNAWEMLRWMGRRRDRWVKVLRATHVGVCARLASNVRLVQNRRDRAEATRRGWIDGRHDWGQLI